MTLQLSPDDPRLTWQGVASLERGPGWVAPWRIPYQQRALFYPERLQERLAMPAGARISFHSDTTLVAGEILCADPESSPIDLCCDGVFFGSESLAGREQFRFEGLPAGEKLVELWLPQFGWFHLRSLHLSPGAGVLPHQENRPSWVTYGSSITQCRGAASPTQTWPAIVARALGLDLYCLGVGGECHLDQVIARVIRDRHADVLSLQMGINVQGGATLSLRTFRPAIIGFVQTVRDGHPDVPIVCRSPIYSPPREQVPNAVGMTLQVARQEVEAAVDVMRAHGDANLHYVSGLDVLGSEFAHLLPDQLHPNAEGYRLMGQRYTPLLAEILGLARKIA